ncbi:ribose-phosphate pyrophosphokinase [Vibrio phage vB_VpaP_SJSY21]|nr:ribose-phosphate pyrophosphokinase [Vibrio phage vB_VpaP_SJSY21]
MIKIYTKSKNIEFDSFTFNGGEEHIRILNPVKGQDVVVYAYIKNSGDVMRLAMVKDALDRMDASHIKLVMPYMPYARQDRVCSYGEAFAVKIMANMINSMKFGTVTIHDPHSDVTPALIDNVDVIAQDVNAFQAISQVLCLDHKNADVSNLVVVAPDAGATKKSEKLADRFKVPVHQALKTRDPSTGKLDGFRFCGDPSDIKGKDIVICDDICDGGGTFIGLGNVLKGLEPKSMTLYITHGIFSNEDNLKELEELYDNVVTSFDWRNIK